MNIRDRIREELTSLIDCINNDRPLQLNVREKSKERTVSMSNKTSITMLHHVKLMVIVNELLATGKTATKREVYYQNERFFGTQVNLDRALDRLARTLKVPRDDLGIIAGAKGLVFSPALGYDKPVLVPKEPHVQPYESIGFVLVVEKEAIFQTIADDYEFLSSVIGHFILVTGKGYPCTATRAYLNHFKRIKVFALVDFDPFGLEIALLYVKGSNNLPDEASTLSCSDLVFLGVTFKDIDSYGDQSAFTKLSGFEVTRLKSLINGNSETGVGKSIKEAAVKMLDKGVKAEIESIPNTGNFFTRTFLLEKLIGLL